MVYIVTVTVLGLIAAATLYTQTHGFATDLRSSIGVFSVESMDHQEITEAGALPVLRDYLLTNPNPQVDSTTAIQSLQNPTAYSLLAAYYHGTDSCGQPQCKQLLTGVHQSFTEALASIQSMNAEVDSAEFSIAKAHFDNEEIPQGNNRLQEKRQSIIASIQNGKYEEARKETGRALHTLQDFYSHSNWVELGNTEPLEGLGRLSYIPSNIASPSTPTCNSCGRGSDANPKLLSILGPFAQFIHEYDCKNNIREEIQSANVLFTGYVGQGPNGEKPPGKCSHAGLIDYTAILEPTGGVNKDTTVNVMSPHYYLHQKAANVAVKATTLFFQDIREAVGNVAFGEYFNIPQLHMSIAFVIDTTESMIEELPQLQAALPRFGDYIESLQKSVGSALALEYILIPLSNPGNIRRTDSATVLRQYIQGLTASGGAADDCRESSIGAITRAARYSKQGGVINVFTDAQPSDVEHLPEAIFLLKEKGLKVNVFSIAGCNMAEEGRIEAKVYQHLAFLSGGQILDISLADLAEADSLVSTFNRPTTLFLEAGSTVSGSVEFQVDSTITKFYVTINGNDLTVNDLRSPQETMVLFTLGHDVWGQPLIQVQLSSFTSYVAIVSVSDDTHYGAWRLTFNSSSSYRVYITGDSYLAFTVTNSRKTEEILEKAIIGEVIIPIIKMEEEAERATVTSASLINSDGSQLLTLNLMPTGVSGASFALAAALPMPFRVQIAGRDSRGFGFTRISGDGVDVSDVQVELLPEQSPFHSMRTGQNVTLSLLLSNHGASSTFTVETIPDGETSGFTYYFSGPTSISLASKGTASLDLIISASKENLSEDNTLSLIIVMVDESDIERNNYFNVRVAGTTVPEVDLSQIDYYNRSEGMERVLSYVILLGCLILGLLWMGYTKRHAQRTLHTHPIA